MGFENSGRRKSAAVRLLHGNPSKRRLKPEPARPSGDVEKPAWLSPDAAGVWDEMAPICRDMGTLTRADRRAFAMLCELEALAARSTDKALLRCATTLRGYYALFGLDPLNRSRLVVPDETPAKWAKLA